MVLRIFFGAKFNTYLYSREIFGKNEVINPMNSQVKILSILIITAVIALSLTIKVHAEETEPAKQQGFLHDGRTAIGAGSGYMMPLGDMADVIDWALPMLVNVQYSPNNMLSIEGDYYIWLYTPSISETLIDEGDEIKVKAETSLYQFGLTARFWPSGFYDGFYLGSGLARTNIKMKVSMEFWGMSYTETVSDDLNTLVMKAGYAVNFESFFIDLGVRYDAVDMEDWGDQPLIIYAIAALRF
jgi:hypothetical protein